MILAVDCIYFSNATAHVHCRNAFKSIHQPWNMKMHFEHSQKAIMHHNKRRHAESVAWARPRQIQTVKCNSHRKTRKKIQKPLHIWLQLLSLFPVWSHTLLSIFSCSFLAVHCFYAVHQQNNPNLIIYGWWWWWLQHIQFFFALSLSHSQPSIHCRFTKWSFVINSFGTPL